MYSIQHYVITFVNDLRQVGGFLRSSESGPYRPITPYVKPFSPPDPPGITTFTGTPVLIDNEEIQTE